MICGSGMPMTLVALQVRRRSRKWKIQDGCPQTGNAYIYLTSRADRNEFSIAIIYIVEVQQSNRISTDSVEQT